MDLTIKSIEGVAEYDLEPIIRVADTLRCDKEIECSDIVCREGMNVGRDLRVKNKIEANKIDLEESRVKNTLEVGNKIFTSASAQDNTYTIDVSSVSDWREHNEIVEETSASNWTTLNMWRNYYQEIELGDETFTYNGSARSELYVSSNGRVTFGSPSRYSWNNTSMHFEYQSIALLFSTI